MAFLSIHYWVFIFFYEFISEILPSVLNLGGFFLANFSRNKLRFFCNCMIYQVVSDLTSRVFLRLGIFFLISCLRFSSRY